MSTINADDCPIHVEVSGPERAPVLMLSNSLGSTLHMWDEQVRPFTEHFRLIRYDRRGHGRSGVTPAPYTIERLGRDALAVLDAFNVKRAHWCGLSLGGMVGMWLGANAPQRFNRIVLANTTSHHGDPAPWADRVKTVRERGLSAIVDATMERWFTADFRARAPKVVQRMRDAFLQTPVEGYVGCCEAIRDMDLRETIRGIKAPTLVIAGRHDPSTTVANAEVIRDGIPGATLAVLDAAHLSNIEQAGRFSDTVLDFLLAQ